MVESLLCRSYFVRDLTLFVLELFLNTGYAVVDGCVFMFKPLVNSTHAVFDIFIS
jgi:hypothetical protein